MQQTWPIQYSALQALLRVWVCKASTCRHAKCFKHSPPRGCTRPHRVCVCTARTCRCCRLAAVPSAGAAGSGCPAHVAVGWPGTPAHPGCLHGVVTSAGSSHGAVLGLLSRALGVPGLPVQCRGDSRGSGWGGGLIGFAIQSKGCRPGRSAVPCGPATVPVDCFVCAMSGRSSCDTKQGLRKVGCDGQALHAWPSGSEAGTRRVHSQGHWMMSWEVVDCARQPRHPHARCGGHKRARG